ncbi:MAG: hypothetical protein Q8P12_02345 [bacterium]|nr:hypothetical protein [bacterium]
MTEKGNYGKGSQDILTEKELIVLNEVSLNGKSQKARIVGRTLHPAFTGLVVEVLRPLTTEEKAKRFQNPNSMEVFLVLSPMPFPHEAWYSRESLQFL